MAETTQQQNIVTAQDATVAPPVKPGLQQSIVDEQQQPYSGPIATYDPRHKYKKTLRGFGIAECIIGGLSVLLAVIADFKILHLRYINKYSGRSYSSYYYASINLTFTSPGVWCGIIIIITGIFGIRVMKTPTRCMHIANLAMCIITACVTIPAVGCSGYAAVYSAYSSTMVSLHAIIIVLCFAGMITAIMHTGFCCSGVCYKSNSVSTHQQVMYHPHQNVVQPPPQYSQVANEQAMIAVNDPTIPQAVSPPPAYQEVPEIVNTVVLPTSSVQHQGVNEHVHEKGPPAYYP